jgi:hypothetical protein
MLGVISTVPREGDGCGGGGGGGSPGSSFSYGAPIRWCQ